MLRCKSGSMTSRAIPASLLLRRKTVRFDAGASRKKIMHRARIVVARSQTWCYKPRS